MTKAKVHKKSEIKTKVHSKKEHSFKEEFNQKNFVEGAIIRPAIQMLSFVTFIIAMFLLLIENYKWGGSMILFSFILNIESIYKSLTDEESIYRTMNLGFKLILFISEIFIFNYVLMKVIN